MIRILALAVLLFAFPAQARVNIDWVAVGDPGNACETQGPDCLGAVSYEYRIGKYEVTNRQYARFLNAVAKTDPNSLYETNMGDKNAPNYGGITRSGSSGSYTYSAIVGREDMPVNWVSWYDSLRFANWLHNGQPTSAAANTTTEDGAYNMYLESAVVRKAGAKVFLASEDEWYKAAYYKGGGTSAGYWDYPAGSDTQTSCTAPGATANTANCDTLDVTDVGSYTGAASPSSTFDQGGNVYEWTETLKFSGPMPVRGLRGGAFYFSDPESLAASEYEPAHPRYDGEDVGFRVASLVPETPSLNPFALATLCTLLGLAGLRRLRGQA
jgi:formylglycine-generating enzyme required for sulfatase activity